MKALCVRQPWADLLASGSKRFETRSWSTEHRGQLAILASPSRTAADAAIARRLEFVQASGGRAFATLPRGAVIGIGLVLSCTRIDELFLRLCVDPEEALLGDFSLGRFAWEIGFAHRLPSPIPAKGQAHLFDWPAPKGVR
jgi:hypothetical protein